MDGFHDLGGFQGFGRVPHTIDTLSYKPVFKEDWEHLAYSLMFVGVDHLKAFSVDEVRHAVERIDVRQHVGTRYYERYVIATATLLVETGVLTQAELDAALGSPFRLANPPHSSGRPAPAGDGQFEPGERVTVRDETVSGHVRAPAYVRGKTGVVLHRTTHAWPFPDTIGHGDTRAVHQPTYHVEFRATDLWSDADEGYVVADLFEGYLDRAGDATPPASSASASAGCPVGRTA